MINLIKNTVVGKHLPLYYAEYNALQPKASYDYENYQLKLGF